MHKATGTVSQIDRKESPSGKTYYRVKVGSQWYSIWEKPGFQAGDTIEFDSIQKGEFFNMANAETVELGRVEVAVQQTQRNTGGAPGRTVDLDRESRIVRQNATSTAAALVSALIAGAKAGSYDPRRALDLTFELAKEIFTKNMHGYELPTGTRVAPVGKPAAEEELFDA